MDLAKVNFTTTRPLVVLKTLKEIDKRFEKGTIEWYQAAWLIMQFDKGQGPSIIQGAERAIKNRSHYVELQTMFNVPWAVIAVIHAMECGNDLKGCLHNGQRIIGTTKKTTIEPIGRGPFKTFRDSGVDALKTMNAWKQVKVWDIGSILKFTELWNGAGYLKYHQEENSPYNWARTNINDGFGKYTSDGKFDSRASADGQIGVAALLKVFEDKKLWFPVYRVTA